MVVMTVNDIDEIDQLTQRTATLTVACPMNEPNESEYIVDLYLLKDYRYELASDDVLCTVDMKRDDIQLYHAVTTDMLCHLDAQGIFMTMMTHYIIIDAQFANVANRICLSFGDVRDAAAVLEWWKLRRANYTGLTME